MLPSCWIPFSSRFLLRVRNLWRTFSWRILQGPDSSCPRRPGCSACCCSSASTSRRRSWSPTRGWSDSSVSPASCSSSPGRSWSPRCRMRSCRRNCLSLKCRIPEINIQWRETFDGQFPIYLMSQIGEAFVSEIEEWRMTSRSLSGIFV